MPRASWTQNNFNAGEWSPLTYGRADLQKYKNSLALCKNYIPTAQGGLTRRPGTKYVAEVKSSSAKVRLQSFEFSITQAYVLEFGNQYVRFYTNGGQLLSGGSPYEVSTPYTTADLDGLSFVQSADVLYIAHPSYAPRTLSRLGATSWSLATISFQDGPYLILNTAATTLTSSATTGSATVTASAVTGINNDTGFQTTDVGRVIRLKVGTNWAWGTITARASTTSITVNWSTTVGGTTASNLWRLGVWNSTNGYPAAITFHQDRLWLAGPTQYPNRVDASVSGDYTNFAPTDATGTVADSNALSFNLASAKMNTINWMVSDEWGLLVGTASNEWVVAANTIQVALTPTNINAKQVTSYGSNTVRPIRMGKSTLFLQRTGRKLREMSYQFVVNTFQAPDISMLSEHLTASGIYQLAAQLAPQPVLWMVRNDGTLVSMSYDKDQEISGWAQHDLGGYSDSAQTQTAIVESIAVIPSQDVTRDDLWISVKRYINGATFRSVELMQKYWEDGDQQVHAFYADCGATYDGTSTSTISGLTWLKGQTVSVLADGAVHPDCVVNSSGVITLDRSVVHANVGLKYTSEAQTMRIEAGGGDGSAQGKLKRIHRAIFRMFQTVGMTVKAGNHDGYPEPFRSSADLMNNPVALYTGDRRWAWDGTYDLEGQVYFAQTDPLPSNILMVVAQLDTQDGG